MSRLMRKLPRAGAVVVSRLAQALTAPRPYGWEVGSAQWRYDELSNDGGIDATRYGDWEYSGRCTDF